jgi:predicted DNA-binding protein (UPF0251 family)
MPAEKYAATRTDGIYIGADIREVVRLMVEDGVPWQRAADAVGVERQRAHRALHKPHVIVYRREQRQRQIELLSTRVPMKLSELMDSENHAAATRAAISLEEMAQQGRAESTTARRLVTGGVVIMLGAPAQQPLPPIPAMPVIEHEPVDGD